MKTISFSILTLMTVGCLFSAAQQSADTAPGDVTVTKLYGSRRLDPEDDLSKSYRETDRSIEAAEKFIRENPEERDLCGGALLNMARLQAREDKKQAIETYQRAVDTYGDELVPDINSDFTVSNWALLRIGRLERDTGNHHKALEIFGELMTSTCFNTRNSARADYLSLKQAHQKVVAEVAVLRRGPYAVGSKIPVAVTVHNPTDKPVTLKCYAVLGRAYAPRSGNEEATLAAGERRVISMEYIEKDTKWMEPGRYDLKAGFTGITFDTNSISVEIVK